MFQPFDDAETTDPDNLCRLVVELASVNDKLTYEFHLEIPDREYISLGELIALREGISQSLIRLDDLIERLDEEED